MMENPEKEKNGRPEPAGEPPTQETSLGPQEASQEAAPETPDADGPGMGTSEEDESSGNYMTEGLCLGLCLGLAIGQLLFHNSGLGICIGICLGLVIGMGIKKKK